MPSLAATAIEKGEKRSYFSLEEEFGPERFFDVRAAGWTHTRVLELAEDPNLFLLERLNFLSIVASTWTSSSWCVWRV